MTANKCQHCCGSTTMLWLVASVCMGLYGSAVGKTTRDPLGHSRVFDLTARQSAKLRKFQFKLLHRRIVTNSFLHKIGIKNRNSCTFCEVERETLFHLFWSCRVVQSFWKILENWLIKYKILPETKSIDKLTALGLKSEYETPLVSLSTLLARNHIYTNKLAEREPDFLRYLQLLKQHAFFENQTLKNTI